MDGYSQQAMTDRCMEDYGWNSLLLESSSSSSSSSTTAIIQTERAEMMAHLYSNPELYQYTSMVAFAEHYVLPSSSPSSSSSSSSKPLQTFLQQQKAKQPFEDPIFAGVVWDDWQMIGDNDHYANHNKKENNKLSQFRQAGMDYVRIHCNLLGSSPSTSTISTSSSTTSTMSISNKSLVVDCQPLLECLARAAQQCQAHELVPLLLVQVPWREDSRENGDGDDNDNGNNNDISFQYFDQAMNGLAKALKDQQVDCSKLLLETRPPIGISAMEERNLSTAERIELGFQVGKQMFSVLDHVFAESNTDEADNDDSTGKTAPTLLGFCVAGGSTKGINPPAMEDDTQNAVRQGIRQSASKAWGHTTTMLCCYWEMGAKLMLTPQVGQLWGSGDKDAARELFVQNAKAMAEEIVQSKHQE
ncbi:unnamed protein product [Cylindrotheca closterium]|uniref:Uncharacterized protein n=1 Tax=Cylindrotheca closterium TaxID=2856 RepID=A0AAD2CH86_9STRA|nr:unnamed protein product [Cylindrotheca closterium]